MRPSLAMACLFLVAVSAQAHAGSETKIIRASSGIQQLQIEVDGSQVEPSVEPTHLSVTLKGKYRTDEWALLIAKKVVKVGSDGQFVIKIPLLKENETVHVFAVAPSGEIEREQLSLQTSHWNDLFASEQPKPAAIESVAKRYHLNAGLGASTLSYQDPRISHYSSTALTAKAGGEYILVPHRWNLSLSAYGTVANLTKTENTNVRFFGVNLCVGSELYEFSNQWTLSLNYGGYYLTMFVSPERFGYANIGGLQLMPSLKARFNERSEGLAYVKFAPVSEKFHLSNIGSNHEIAFGLAYDRIMSSGITIGPTLDVAFQTLKINSVPFNSSSATLGIAFGR
jgi:hypothetical protein